MPRIAQQKSFNGAEERIRRLGVESLWKELLGIVTGFPLHVCEERDSNGGAAVRELIDQRFAAIEGWEKRQAGDIDWKKCQLLGNGSVCLGVEVQFSGRSDLLIVDVVHLREQINDGNIDVGSIIVP